MKLSSCNKAMIFRCSCCFCHLQVKYMGTSKSTRW